MNLEFDISLGIDFRVKCWQHFSSEGLYWSQSLSEVLEKKSKQSDALFVCNKTIENNVNIEYQRILCLYFIATSTGNTELVLVLTVVKV